MKSRDLGPFVEAQPAEQTDAFAAMQESGAGGFSSVSSFMSNNGEKEDRLDLGRRESTSGMHDDVTCYGTR